MERQKDPRQRYPVYVEGKENGFAFIMLPENHPLVSDTIYDIPDMDFINAVMQQAYEVAEPVFKKSPEDEPEEISQEAWNTVALMTAIDKVAKSYMLRNEAHRRGEEITTFAFLSNMGKLTNESDEIPYRVSPRAVAELEQFIDQLEPKLSKEEVKAVYDELKAYAEATYISDYEEPFLYRGENEGFPLEWLGLQPNIPPPTPPAPNIHSIGRQMEKPTPEPIADWDGATYRHKTTK